MAIKGFGQTDTLVSVDTPEGLTFLLKPAGVYARALAFCIDMVIVCTALFILAIIMAILQFTASWLLLLLFFTMQWLYTALFEGFNAGRTPGKMALGLQVVHDDGTPVDFSSAFLRNLLRAADAPLMAFGLGFALMGLSSGFRRLGDLAAGTLVIYKPRARAQAASGIQRSWRGIVPVPPPRALDPEETAAVLSYAGRYDQFSAARAQELAKTALAGLYAQEADTKTSAAYAPDRLLGIAAWLLGVRLDAQKSAGSM